MRPRRRKYGDCFEISNCHQMVTSDGNDQLQCFDYLILKCLCVAFTRRCNFLITGLNQEPFYLDFKVRYHKKGRISW